MLTRFLLAILIIASLGAPANAWQYEGSESCARPDEPQWVWVYDFHRRRVLGPDFLQVIELYFDEHTSYVIVVGVNGFDDCIFSVSGEDQRHVPSLLLPINRSINLPQAYRRTLSAVQAFFCIDDTSPEFGSSGFFSISEGIYPLADSECLLEADRTLSEGVIVLPFFEDETDVGYLVVFRSGLVLEILESE